MRLCILALVSLTIVIPGCVSGCRSSARPVRTTDTSFGRKADTFGPYQSVSLGEPVPQPEVLSGLWEAGDGRGGYLGLLLSLTTTVPPSIASLRGAVQHWGQLQAGLYRREGPNISFGEANYFTDAPGEGLRYDRGHLTLQTPEYGFDLNRTEDGSWTGRLHRRHLDTSITLRRLQAASRSASDWYLGTWVQHERDATTVLHMGRAKDGKVLGWCDHLVTYGGVFVAQKMPGPALAEETYGTRAKVVLVDPNKIMIELATDSGWCCPHPFTASKVSHGEMDVDWSDGPNQFAHHSRWRRVRDEAAAF